MDAAANDNPDAPGPEGRLSRRTGGRVPDIVGLSKDHLDSFSPAERKVGAAVLADIRLAVHERNGALAARAGVSESSVKRFCRAIFCDGVRDFKLKLAQSLVVGKRYLNARAAPDASEGDAPAFWAPILADARDALREVERQLAPAAVLAAAGAVARQAAAFGLGGSAAPLAQETRHRLFRYEVRAVCCTDPYIMRMTTATLGPADVVIAVSGETAELIEAVDLARGYGATTIAVTAMASPLADAVDHLLTVTIAESPDTLTPTAARTAYLAIVDLLSAATGYALGPVAHESLRRIKYTAMSHRSGNLLVPLGA